MNTMNSQNTSPDKKNNPKKSVQGNVFKGIFVYVLLILFALYLFYTFFVPSNTDQEVSLTEVANDINNEEVETILVQENKLFVTYKDGQVKTAQADTTEGVISSFSNLGVDLSQVDIQFASVSDMSLWINVIMNFFPIILLVASLLYRLLITFSPAITRDTDEYGFTQIAVDGHGLLFFERSEKF